MRRVCSVKREGTGRGGVGGGKEETRREILWYRREIRFSSLWGATFTQTEVFTDTERGGVGLGVGNTEGLSTGERKGRLSQRPTRGTSKNEREKRGNNKKETGREGVEGGPR